MSGRESSKVAAEGDREAFEVHGFPPLFGDATTEVTV